MYVGVKTTLPVEECVGLLAKTGQLDMKIGSSERVDSLFRQGSRGLSFTHAPAPPRALPSPQGLIYFQVDREPERQEWQNIWKSLTLAIRLNERHIEGDVQGQEVLKIRTAGGQSTTLGFTLYLVPQAALAEPAPVVVPGGDAGPQRRLEKTLAARSAL
jgi:type VI secretion system protein ImpJ